MADTTTLQATNPLSATPRENSVRPAGAMGYFDETLENTMELIFKGEGALVQEGPVTHAEVEQARRLEGSMDGFQTARTKAELDPELRARNIQESILSVHRQEQMAESVAQKRIEVNTKLGIGNVLYEDTVNSDGSLRIDVEVDLERKNSELSEAELKTQREKQIAEAKGKARGGFQVGENELINNEKRGWKDAPG